jgi:hypothetical protein
MNYNYHYQGTYLREPPGDLLDPPLPSRRYGAPAEKAFVEDDCCCAAG